MADVCPYRSTVTSIPKTANSISKCIQSAEGFWSVYFVIRNCLVIEMFLETGCFVREAARLSGELMKRLTESFGGKQWQQPLAVSLVSTDVTPAARSFL